MTLALTDLTDKQQKRLNNLAKNEPLTVVIGWSETISGPILRRVDGSVCILGKKGYIHGL